MKNAKEIICKNCKYHYIEEISFDYPQSCCSKRQITTEEWLKCNDFEYDDRYILQLQQENQELKNNVNALQKELNEENLQCSKYAIENQELKKQLKYYTPDENIAYFKGKNESKMKINRLRSENKELKEENKILKDNWNKLREYFNERIEVCDNRLSSPFCNFEKATKERLIFTQCLEKLEELEQGSDSDE